MKNYFSIMVLTSFLVIFICSCSKEDNTTNPQTQINSCVGCHTNYDALKRLHTPDTGTTGGGCSGEAPHYEPYDRVYLGGEGYQLFKKSEHGKLPCTSCHNGTDGTDDKKLAHSNNFIKYPSRFAKEKCQSCHPDEVARTTNSIHEQGWGQKRKVTVRYGLAGSDEFHKLPPAIIAGYDKNCASCHASCGDCHVNRPHAGGGGLMNGHNFSKKPDMVEVCVTCHKSRGGHAYLGVAPGSQPDIHLTKKGFDCMSCHTKNEIHGDGNKYETRFHVKDMPKCTDCHKDVAKSNIYHGMHAADLTCYTCHSQDYNNCGSCHIELEGARIPSYQSFKIGMNPIKDVRDYKLALLRRTLMAPDSWSNFGVPVLPNFDAFPTYNFTTPHNIQRWTSRTKTESGKACYDNCHIVKEGDTFRNIQLYLFKKDLLPWELIANEKVTVDGKLPSKWGL